MNKESGYLAEEKEVIRELSDNFGIYEPIAEDCMSSNTPEDMEIILKFLRRYGRMIKVK